MASVTSNKLHVGGLSWETDEAALRGAFEPYGPLVAVSIARDPGSGRPMGHGFVTFANSASADEARVAMTSAVIDGSTIRVTEAPDPPG